MFIHVTIYLDLLLQSYKRNTNFVHENQAIILATKQSQCCPFFQHCFNPITVQFLSIMLSIFSNLVSTKTMPSCCPNLPCKTVQNAAHKTKICIFAATKTSLQNSKHCTKMHTSKSYLIKHQNRA